MTSSNGQALLRVALLLDTRLKGVRSLVSGISAWAHAHGPWRIIASEGRSGEQAVDPLLLGVDGAIASGTCLRQIVKLAKANVPVVAVDPIPSKFHETPWLSHTPVVQMDSRAIGVFAARFFLERRYRHFAYVTETEDVGWSRDRFEGFSGTLAAEGFGCDVYGQPPKTALKSWARERPRMMRFLQAAPKPLAILAAMDGRARLVLDACAEAGITVPRDVAVLGVDDDTTICCSTFPRLSSIVTGSFHRGEIVAETLARLMSGESVPNFVTTDEPARVVVRESTGHDAMRNPFLEKGLIFIRDTPADRDLSVSDVVTAMRCSRRHAETLFRTLLGCSVNDEINRVKFEHVKTMLDDTGIAISDVAARCGFSNASRLATDFKSRFGMTMSEWRRR